MAEAQLAQRPTLRAAHSMDETSTTAPSRGRPAATAQRPWYEGLLAGVRYELVLDDEWGYPLVAFRDGQWFDVKAFTASPITLRAAALRNRAWASAVVATSLDWVRANPTTERAFELRTEVALLVGELV